MVLFHNFRMDVIEWYDSMDEFQTTNEWSIILSIIVLKHITVKVFLFDST